MSEYLFVYGSLKRGCGGRQASEISNELTWIGKAEVRGRLYDFGEYCGAIIDTSAPSVIKGELLELPNTSMLKRLDGYENYDPATSDSLFVRQKVETIVETGSSLEAWIYTYNRHPGDAPVIANGEYSKRGTS